MSVPGSEPVDWAVRVVSLGPRAARAYTRNHAIELGLPASLAPSDAAPSAIEYLLAALGGDLAYGLRREAVRRSIEVDALEVSLKGRLENALVQLGVIGESGYAGLSVIEGSIYVSTGGSEAELAECWARACERSPTYQTLARAVRLEVALVVTP